MNIKQIRFRKKSIEIRWEYHGTEYTSMLYRHSDYSWHPDADTRRMPPVMQEELQHQVWLCLSAGQKKKPERKKTANTWFADSR